MDRVFSGSPYEDRVGYSRAIRRGPYVAVSGTTADGDGAAAQTREVLRRIDTALREAGASLSDVVRTRIYVTDIARWPEIAEVHAEVFGAIRPAATMVEVARLIAPDLVVEIEADALVAPCAWRPRLLGHGKGGNRPSEPGT